VIVAAQDQKSQRVTRSNNLGGTCNSPRDGCAELAADLTDDQRITALVYTLADAIPARRLARPRSWGSPKGATGADTTTDG
jgi:hypothetical protein